MSTLVLILLGSMMLDGDPDDAPRPLTGPLIENVIFDLALEEWVRDTVHPWRYDQVLPEELANAVRSLGCEHYGCRTTAFDVILRHKNGIRAAFWASHAKDPEMVLYGRKLLKRLMPCQHCDGSGMCPRRWGNKNAEVPDYVHWDCAVCERGSFQRWAENAPDWWPYRCLNCGGRGSLDFLLEE